MSWKLGSFEVSRRVLMTFLSASGHFEWLSLILDSRCLSNISFRVLLGSGPDESDTNMCIEISIIAAQRFERVTYSEPKQS